MGKYNNEPLFKLTRFGLTPNIVKGGYQNPIGDGIFQMHATKKGTDNIFVGKDLAVDDKELVRENNGFVEVLSHDLKLPNKQSPVGIYQSLVNGGLRPAIAFNDAFRIQEGYKNIKGINNVDKQHAKDGLREKYDKAKEYITNLFSTKEQPQIINDEVSAEDLLYNRLLREENSKRNKSGGYDEKTDRWVAHESPEGGSKTIGYGFKLGIDKELDDLYERQGYLTNNQVEEQLRKYVKTYLRDAGTIYTKKTGEPFDSVPQFYQSVLGDIQYNPGLSIFPNLMNAVKNRDVEKIKQNVGRTYVDDVTKEVIPLTNRNTRLREEIADYDNKQRSRNKQKLGGKTHINNMQYRDRFEVGGSDNLKLPTRKNFVLQNAKDNIQRGWEAIKNNDFVNLFFPLQDVAEGNSLAALTNLACVGKVGRVAKVVNLDKAFTARKVVPYEKLAELGKLSDYEIEHMLDRNNLMRLYTNPNTNNKEVINATQELFKNNNVIPVSTTQKTSTEANRAFNVTTNPDRSGAKHTSIGQYRDRLELSNADRKILEAAGYDMNFTERDAKRTEEILKKLKKDVKQEKQTSTFLDKIKSYFDVSTDDIITKYTETDRLKSSGAHSFMKNGGKYTDRIINGQLFRPMNISTGNQIKTNFKNGGRVKASMGELALGLNSGFNLANIAVQGGLGEYIGNKELETYNKMNRKSTFVPIKAQHINTKVDVNPQLDEIRNNKFQLENIIDANTNSSKTRFNRHRSLASESLSKIQNIFGYKTNTEIGLRNQNAQNQFEADKINTQHKINDIIDENNFNLQKLIGMNNAITKKVQTWGQSIAQGFDNASKTFSDYTKMLASAATSTNPNLANPAIEKLGLDIQGIGNNKNSKEYIAKYNQNNPNNQISLGFGDRIMTDINGNRYIYNRWTGKRVKLTNILPG